MTLQQLQYCVTLAGSDSFVAASKRLFLTQPTLSRSIANLEAELGVPLLNRDHRAVELTPAGEVFLEKAKEILHLVDMAVQSTRMAVTDSAGQLRLGFVGYKLNLCFPAYVVPFMGKYPEIGLVVDQDYPAQLIAKLQNGKIDMAICTSNYVSTLCSEDTLGIKKLFRETYNLVVPDNHPCARYDKLDDFSMLNGETLLTIDPAHASQFLQLQLKICSNRGYQPTVFVKSNSMDVINIKVASGMGVSIMPQNRSILAETPGVKVIALEGEDVSTDVVAIWDPQSKNKAIQKFLDFVDTMDLPAPAGAGEPAAHTDPAPLSKMGQ